MENIDIASYADDNTPYTTGNSIEEVIQNLENATKTLFQWFSDNQMKANPDRCHFFIVWTPLPHLQMWGAGVGGGGVLSLQNT